MRLVNPVGRKSEEITNQANYGCGCSVSDGSFSAADSNVPINVESECCCACHYGYENAQANHSIGYAKTRY